MMKDKTSLAALFANMKEQMVLMTFSGVCGMSFRAVLAPKEQWKRRVVQAIAGALSCLSAGFLMGSGGELAVKVMQDRLMAKK